ncbi:MAG: hypothetical protein H5T43_00100 [Methanomethylovorans sp.]|nr:hypothetical protein [Methanomethylovorans sp.]
MCFVSVASTYATYYYWNVSYVGYAIDSSVPGAYTISVHAAANSWTMLV